MKFREKKYTLAQQYASLEYCRGLNGSGKLTRHGFNYEFSAKPSPLSRNYSIRITMKRNKWPNVYVASPNLLELANDRKIPHLYSQKKQKLCLFLPKVREWHFGKILSRTVVPWIYLWLFYFEEWLFSDEWKGGGIHPDTTNED